ncbi:MAG: DUF2203 domain-containing protein [Sulfolobales archaeon]|jgi:Uncharacterized conserved protein|nr:DUF2203 domain-containing protein [Sulfolobales archaeon]
MEPEYPFFDLKAAKSLVPELRRLHREYTEVKRKVEEALLSGDKEALSEYTRKVNEIVTKITRMGVMIRDLDMGLFDFPAVIDGRSAYLCWKVDEPDVMYYHYAEDGFAGRKRISERTEILPLT